MVVALHNRFPELFTPPFSSLLLQGLKPGSPSHAADKDIQEKENNARIIKQRTTLRIVGELEAIGIVRKESGGGGKGEKSTAGMTGEITWAALRDLVSLGTSSASFPREADPPQGSQTAHVGQGSAPARRPSRYRFCQTPRTSLPPSSSSLFFRCCYCQH